MKTGVLRISDWAGYVPHMDLNLGRSCPQMGPSWGQVAPSWAEAEANWSKLGQCCCHVESKRALWTILGRSAKRANHQSRAFFWRSAPFEKAPPSPLWSCTSLTVLTLLVGSVRGTSEMCECCFVTRWTPWREEVHHDVCWQGRHGGVRHAPWPQGHQEVRHWWRHCGAEGHHQEVKRQQCLSGILKLDEAGFDSSKLAPACAFGRVRETTASSTDHDR